MNRLKYRVWITPWGSDTSPYMYYIEDLHLGAAIGNWERGGYKDAVFQQYTGLQDKNGKEIYEGDIVKALPATRYGMGIDQGQYDYMLLRKPKFVLYFDGSYKLFDKIPHNKSDLVENYYIDANIEIIGNIFENPELLKNE